MAENGEAEEEIDVSYFGIGIENCKTEANLGTLWRSAHAYGAAFMFVIGRRYHRQSSDTTKAWRQLPLYHYEDFDDFYRNIPYDCALVGVETAEAAIPVQKFIHPKRAVYLLGAEDRGLTKNAKAKCHRLLIIPGLRCLNVACAGTIVMYDRLIKRDKESEIEFPPIK